MTINCNGRLLDLTTPKVMGILNTTPDSFFDGGKYTENEAILERADRMLAEGAAILDIGGYSSRPHAAYVSEDEEMRRVVPAIRLIAENFPQALISVDTFRSNVAKASVWNGAAIVNDISAGILDDDMLDTVASLGVPYIMMHMRGNPQTMTQFKDYDDVVAELLSYFAERAKEARSRGISDIIIDPGFGFSKTTEQNYEVLGKLDVLTMAGLPILAGISRKSMIYKTLGISVGESLNATTIANTIALQKGASILRVHDVREAVECVKLCELAKAGTQPVNLFR